MKARLLLTVAVALFITVSAAPTVEDDVYVLDPSNFDDFVNNEEITLVEFYAPWCGHCKKLAPEYAKAAGVLKKDDPPIKIAKVDADAQKELGSRFGVSGFPTLKVFRRGTASEYKGPREGAGIVSYMRKQAAPAVKELQDLKALEKWLADEAGLVLFGSSSDTTYATFKAAADSNRETLRFAVVDSEDARTQFKAPKGSVLFLQSKRYTQSPLETSSHVYDGSVSESALVKWAKERILPLVGEVTQDNAQFYAATNKPLVKVFVDVDWIKNPKGVNYHLNRIRKVAKDFVGKLHFAVADKKAFAREADDLAGAAYGINDPKLGKYKGDGEATPETLRKFAEDYLANKLEVFVKSEPIPEKNDDDVTVVVGKNFKDIVLDESKDVLLEAYAPWCGHCKSLEPKYKELAKRLVPQNKDNLVIAKVDATANDLPANYQARGFPTIFFAPANNKQNPVKYEGAREVKDFVQFLKKNAKYNIVDDAKDEL